MILHDEAPSELEILQGRIDRAMREMERALSEQMFADNPEDRARQLRAQILKDASLSSPRVTGLLATLNAAEADNDR